MRSFPHSSFRAGAPAGRRGSALLLVLWALLLLGMAVFGVVEMVELSVQKTSHDERALDARGLALSGVALGSNPQLLKDDPLFHQKPEAAKTMDVTIESSGARMNLNYVLLSKHKEILENLFSQWGVPLDQAQRVAECMYDWVTPGDLKSLNGAKALDYEQAGLPQRPTYQAFQTLEEVDLVMGMDIIDKAKPDWKDSFTLWSSGPLDIKEAPADLIAAVFGIDPQRVTLFTSMRNGRDGIPGTSDDVQIGSLTQLEGQLGLSALQIQTYGNQLSFGSPLRRITSVGAAGGAPATISVVTRLNTSPIQYFLWSEQ
jgi:general secretion pathway protein K